MRKLLILGLIGTVLVGTATFLFAPEPSYAQGLIPCGGCSVPIPTSTGECPAGAEQDPCNFCHIFKLGKNILDIFLFPIIPIIASLLFAIGGFVFLSSLGSPQRLGQAKTIVFATIIGVLIIYGAHLFIGLLLTSLGAASFSPGLWWEIDCRITVEPPKVAVTLEASPSVLLEGESATLTWDLEEPADECEASGNWTGDKSPFGSSEPTGPLAAGNYTYTIECKKQGAVDSDSVALSVMPIVTAPGNVFVTSGEWTGDVGGIAGADEKCYDTARNQGYAGTWIAWISVPPFTHAANRIPNQQAFVNMAGLPVASDKADLLDGSLTNAIGYDETGNPRIAFVWTGTNADGTASTDFCSNWTSGSSGDPGVAGDSTATGPTWSNQGTAACNNNGALYCFKQ